MVETPHAKWIAGFWKRIGAFLIDSLFIGLLAFLLGLMFEHIFVRVGGWGRLVGFSFCLVYFGLMNSVIYDGQTLGKKLLGIRVVGSDNQPISVLRSIGRYCIIATPYFLNYAQIPYERLPTFLFYCAALFVHLALFGGSFSIIYLFIFNRKTRQSLHDLAVGSYVVNVDTEKQDVGHVWRPHLIIVALFFVALTTVLIWPWRLRPTQPSSDLAQTHQDLEDHELVIHASISTLRGTWISTGQEPRVTKYLLVRAKLKENQVENAALAREIATSITKTYPLSLELDLIVINLEYGFDLGIASKWIRYSHRFDTREFSELDIVPEIQNERED